MNGTVPVSVPVSGARDVAVSVICASAPSALLDVAGSDGVGVGVSDSASSARTQRAQEFRERRGSSGEGTSTPGCVGDRERTEVVVVLGDEEEAEGIACVAMVSVSDSAMMMDDTESVDRARFKGLLDFPDEILLHIFSYLDLPDLALLARLSPALAPLTADPVLHLHRLRIVSPSRVSHGLFARGPHGQLLRPSVGDLVQRGVLRGLGIERAWRIGGYWGSARSKLQYENGRTLARRVTCNILATQLRRRTAGVSIRAPATSGPLNASQPRSIHAPAASSLRGLYLLQVVPDVEGSSPQIARALLPTMRKLKWCLQRDRLARVFKESGVSYGSVGAWLATPAGAERGWRVLVRERDEEKLRLAVCPDIKRARSVFEALAAGARKG
ncbi:hypothetical protein D9619_002569 [Psilocybe cf. subviscida]|uniref:F-box domain-containing protein n=1 Tax=Psilocybe cf. subviscida TaxID=2480587 RepID=A0A8H5AZF6_9AGAR|nr:hypothetical protein D9619_002569 [Psilocybe cf. subviscida]